MEDGRFLNEDKLLFFTEINDFLIIGSYDVDGFYRMTYVLSNTLQTKWQNG